MPTARDYLIATIMGEDNRADAQGMQGIADVILNRQGQASSYGARSNSIQDIVTARNGMEFNAWRPSDNSYDRTTRALQGIDAMRGAEVGQYRQAAQVVDDMLERGIGRGISQGSTFYQTPNAPNQYQSGTLWPRYGSVTIGNHVYTGPQLVRDRAEYERRNPDLFTSQQAPAPQQDGFGVIFNPGGALDTGAGSVGTLGRPYETGDQFGFSGGNYAGDAGPGSFDLGGAYPNQSVDPYAFGGTYNVAGGTDPGSFSGFLPPTETGGGYNFTGLNLGAGVGNGAFGSGIVQPGPAPDPYGFSASNFGGGVSPGIVGELPAGFDPAAYLAQNRDVAASGMDAATHWRNFGAAEGRALAPPGWTQTQGSPGLTPTGGAGVPTPTFNGGLPASTIGAPAATGGLPPGFDAQAYTLANPDVAASGQDPTQHFLTWGQYDVRALAPGQEARVHAAPGSISPYGGTVQASAYGAPSTTPTIGPDGGINVVSTGLTPTYSPPPTTPSFAPGGGASAFGMPSTPAPTLGAPDASSALPPFFSPRDYVAANADLAGMSDQQAIDHFQNYGRYETRALAPWLQASVYAPPSASPTIGAPAATPTYGAPAATPTLDAPSLTPTIGVPGLTPTMGAPSLTPTLAAPPAIPSWSPFGGLGISNQFGFSGANVGSALGATPQTFASAYPLDTNIGFSSGGSSGGGAGISDPFAFSGADVSGFDVNAAPPSEGGGGGGGGGTAKGSSSSAAFLQDQARTRAYWDTLAKPADLYGYTNTHTPPVVAAPTVPNLTLSNLALGAPGAMFSMFAPWR